MGSLNVATYEVTTSNAPVADRNGDFQAFKKSFEIASVINGDTFFRRLLYTPGRAVRSEKTVPFHALQ